MELLTYQEVPPRALNVTHWGAEDTARDINNVLEKLYPEESDTEADWKLVTGISVPSSLFILTIAIVAGIYFHKKRSKPSKADVDFNEIASPDIAASPELIQVDTATNPIASRKDPDYI